MPKQNKTRQKKKKKKHIIIINHVKMKLGHWRKCVRTVQAGAGTNPSGVKKTEIGPTVCQSQQEERTVYVL